MFKKSILFFLSLMSLFIKSEEYKIEPHLYNLEMIKENIQYLSFYNNQEIKPLDNTGLYFFKENEEVFFITKDAKYLIRGDIIEIKNNDYYQAHIDKDLIIDNFNILNLINKGIIIYEPEIFNQTIYVFMDYTCPYCKKFHKEYLNKLLEYRIRVIYIPFVRDLNLNTLNNTINTFCIEDEEYKKQIFDNIINEKEVDIKQCDNDYFIRNNIKKGFILNLIGTPAIFSEDGRYIGGLIDFFSLIKEIKK